MANKYANAKRQSALKGSVQSPPSTVIAADYDGMVALFTRDERGGTPSDTSDREPLLTIAAAIVARHRLPFGLVYKALNLFAGVACARDMNCDQIVGAVEFGARLLAGTATATDFELIDLNRTRLGIASAQLELLEGVR